ncbi:MAG: AraC family transcriptional regulator [Alistipes sp.]
MNNIMMDHQPQSQFEESALKENCSADCSSCPTFPAPFRRIGESTYCRFAQISLEAGQRITFPGDRMVRILFVLSGSLVITHGTDAARLVTSKQCACLARGESFETAAQDLTQLVVLSLIHRIEFCEQDIFNRAMPYDTVIPTESAPLLSIHPTIERLISELFLVPEMSNCARYHKMKATELFMMIKVLYTPTEHAYFFQSMIQPQDNFCVFVCNNYDKAQGVAELAALAGMSLSVFKRRFSEHFNDSVYHWMMRQKALRIFEDIRDGEDSTKALMTKYEFRHYTQFSRFCKNYLQSTPAQLIASIKEG